MIDRQIEVCYQMPPPSSKKKYANKKRARKGVSRTTKKASTVKNTKIAKKKPFYKKRKPSKTKAFIKILLGLVLLGLVALGLVALSVIPKYYKRTQQYDMNRLHLMSDQMAVDRADKKNLPPCYGPKPILVSIDQVSPHLINALLIREDKRFRQHKGVDWLGVVRATLRNLKDRDVVQGAGTITMQVVRTAYDQKEKSLERKVMEALVAQRVEKNFTKDQILALYCSWVFLGEGHHGVERACRAWYGKTARNITLGEAATIAGILRAPNRFSPVTHPDRAKKERDVVIRRMKEEGVISVQEMEKALAEDFVVIPPYRKNRGINPRRERVPRAKLFRKY